MLRAVTAGFSTPSLWPATVAVSPRTQTPSALISDCRRSPSSTRTMAAGKGISAFADKDGHFKRQTSSFRDEISRKPGAKFPPAKGRYHLYVSLACPWAHRALIVCKLKGLDDIIGTSVVHPFMGDEGWTFNGKGYEGWGAHGKDIADVTGDQANGVDRLRDLYFKVDPNYSARFTVPTLWDSQQQTIVNNESSEIIRFLNTEFDDLIDEKYRGLTFYPEKLQKEIDEVNDWVYDTVNNGVYNATTQEAYESNVKPLFESLDRLEKMLSGKDYLVGGQLTEADIRLFTTIIRFDPVYVGHFKCNIGTIRGNYPNIHRWAQQLYWKNDAFKSTTNFEHIKIHYYTSHPSINPTRVVPFGPVPHIEPLAK